VATINKRQLIQKRLEIPAGYWVEYGGTYQNCSRRSQRPLSCCRACDLADDSRFTGGLGLGSFKDCPLIIPTAGFPLALTGDALLLYCYAYTVLYISRVGFIALSGIANC